MGNGIKIMKRYIIVVFCILSVFSQAQMRIWFDKPTRSLDTLSFYDYSEIGRAHV